MSCREPETGLFYRDCVAPSPALIRTWIEQYFETAALIPYPPCGEPDSAWRRKALLLADRRKT